MSAQRPPASWRRWLTLPLIGLFLVIPTAAAVACQLCFEAARGIFTDDVQLDMADRVVLAVPGAISDQYHVVAVVKGNDAVGDIDAASVTGIDAQEQPSTDPYLIVRAGDDNRWTSLGTIPVEYADWLRQLAATLQIRGERPQTTRRSSVQKAGVLSYAGWRQRIAIVLPRLEDSNPLARRIAWGEVSRAPYEVLDVARTRVDATTVAGWLKHPALGRASRSASYTLLLGFVGSTAEAAVLEQRLEVAWRSHDAADLAAMIAADLELRGPARVEWVESKYFVDHQRTMPEIEAALLALDVHGEANRTISRERVIQAYRIFIKEHASMAGFVAPQLADWSYWDLTNEYEALLNSGSIKDPASEFAVVTYLNAAKARTR